MSKKSKPPPTKNIDAKEVAKFTYSIHGKMLEDYLRNPVNAETKNIIKDSAEGKRDVRAKAYGTLLDFLNNQLGENEYVTYQQIKSYLSRLRINEDKQRKIENKYKQNVSITGNLPGVQMEAIDGESSAANPFLTSDPGEPADYRMELTQSNESSIIEAARASMPQIDVAVKPKQKKAPAIPERTTGISKPIFLKESLKELKQTEQSKRDLYKALKLESELRITLLVEQNPTSTKIMQLVENMTEQENVSGQILQLEEE